MVIRSVQGTTNKNDKTNFSLTHLLYAMVACVYLIRFQPAVSE